MPLRVRPYSTILSITIAHTQIEATSSPSMTVFTIQCAFQNKVKIERSEEASGNADCARSAEFIGYPFASPEMPGDRIPRRRGWFEGTLGGPSTFRRSPKLRRKSAARHRHDVRPNVSKLGRKPWSLPYHAGPMVNTRLAGHINAPIRP